MSGVFHAQNGLSFELCGKDDSEGEGAVRVIIDVRTPVSEIKHAFVLSAEEWQQLQEAMLD